MPDKPRARWFQLRLRTLLVGLTLLAAIPGGYVVYHRGEARKQKAAVAKLEALGAEVYSRPHWLHSLLEPGAPGYVVGIGLRQPHLATDASIAPLAGFSELVWLDLQGTSITDAGLVHIAGLKKLERLRLDETQVTDAGLVHLTGLPKLRNLNLTSTRITDGGLAHLESHPNLYEVYLQKTPITDAGIQQLRQARPDLNIDGSVAVGRPVSCTKPLLRHRYERVEAEEQAAGKRQLRERQKSRPQSENAR